MNKPSQLLILLLTFIIPHHAIANWVGTGLKFGEPKVQKSFKQENEEITFETNPLNELTLSFIGPQYSFGLQFTAEKNDDGEFLNSQYSDFIISFYSSSYIVDLYFNDFSDLYIQSDREEINNGNLKDTISGSSIGARTLFFLDGTNIQENYGEYVLSPKTSMGLFYDFSVEHSILKSDDELVPQKYQSSFSKLNGIKSVTADSITTLVGASFLYAWEYIYINSYLKVGPNFDSQLIENDQKNSSFLVTPSGEAFLGIAYYDQQLQIGLRAKISQSLSQINGVEYKDAFGVGHAYILILF